MGGLGGVRSLRFGFAGFKIRNWDLEITRGRGWVRLQSRKEKKSFGVQDSGLRFSSIGFRVKGFTISSSGFRI